MSVERDQMVCPCKHLAEKGAQRQEAGEDVSQGCWQREAPHHTRLVGPGWAVIHWGRLTEVTPDTQNVLRTGCFYAWQGQGAHSTVAGGRDWLPQADWPLVQGSPDQMKVLWRGHCCRTLSVITCLMRVSIDLHVTKQIGPSIFQGHSL